MIAPLPGLDADVPPSFLRGGRVEVRVRGPLVDADAAWALLGDTDWLNRVAGSGALLSMDMASQRDGLPVVSGVLDGPAGLKFPFEEAWTSWSRGRWFRQIRAFALADQWQIDRARVLDAFIGGVGAGAVELFWSVRCARCYGQVAAATALSDLPDHVDCPACQIRTDSDLGENVEVLFAPHPALVPRSDERFCTMYPAAAPEQYGVYTLAPGQVLEDDVRLPPGEWRLGAAGRAADLHLISSAGGPSQVVWTASQGAGFTPGAPAVSVGTGAVRLHLENDLAARMRVYLTSARSSEPVVLASALTTRASYRRAFSHQVLSPNLRVSVRAVCVLFTDLAGSTAMYEEVGDARAFAIVRDHFSLLRHEIEAGGGVVVKTIGDAVMAAFHEPQRAVEAAIRMQAAFPAFALNLGLSRPLMLKVGLHYGPALAVHGDPGGLDWFGGTVNLAARAQGAAHAGETLLTGAMWALEEVRGVVKLAGMEGDTVDAELKGIAGTTRLWRLVRR